MKNCKDCTYWGSHTDQYGRTWTECESANWVDRTGTLENDELGYYADASDDTGLTAGLKTGPTFGCVRWSSK
jgi:hypothetical protein